MRVYVCVDDRAKLSAPALATREDPERARSPCTHPRSSHGTRRSRPGSGKKVKVGDPGPRAGLARKDQPVYTEGHSRGRRRALRASGRRRLAGALGSPRTSAQSPSSRGPRGASLAGSLSTSPRTPCPRGVTASKLGRSWQRAAWGVCPCQARGRPEAPTQPSGSQQGRPLGPAPSRACAVALDLCWSRVLAAGR